MAGNPLQDFINQYVYSNNPYGNVGTNLGGEALNKMLYNPQNQGQQNLLKQLMQYASTPNDNLGDTLSKGMQAGGTMAGAALMNNIATPMKMGATAMDQGSKVLGSMVSGANSQLGPYQKGVE